MSVSVCVCVCVCIQLQEGYRYVHSVRFLSGVHNRGGGCSLACILPFVFWLKHADQLQWRSDLAEFERKVTVQIDQLYDQYILGADVDVESLQLFADQHPQFLNKDREAECAVFTLDRIMQLSAGHVCASLQVDRGAKFFCTKNPSLAPQGYGYVGHL